jgi:hypothetical protein
MAKAILASILLVPFLIARQAAGARRARAGHRRLVVFVVAFEMLYVFAVAYLYFRVS